MSPGEILSNAGSTPAWLLRVQRAIGVSRVADVTHLDYVGMPVVQVIRPLSWNYVVSQGKGLTRESAEISATLEAAELHHAALARTAERCSIGAMNSRLSYSVATLPAGESELEPSLVVDWVRAENLVTGAAELIPRNLFCTDYRARERIYRSPFRRTTNGLGAGRQLDAATLHALYEVLERNCASRSVPEVLSLDGLPVAPATLRDRIQASGLELRLWHLPNEFALPCLKASVFEPGTGVVFSGIACAGAAERALLGAMTEAVQSRLTVITGSRDDLADRHYRGWSAAEQREQGAGPARTFRELPELRAASAASELGALVERVRARSGVAPLRVDLTLPESGVAVAYVAAPGLQFNGRWH